MRFRPVLLALLAGSLGGWGGTGAAQARRLDPAALDRSLDLGRQYLLNSQRADGSLIHEMDAVRGTDLGTRNAVREAGGLWAIAVLHRRQPTHQTAISVAKGLRLQDTFAKRTAEGGSYLGEPGAREWTTNSVALYALTLTDFLAADHDLDPAFRAKCERDLADSVKFLLSLRLPGGRFFSQYRCADGRGSLAPTPSADGQTLLALARAAKDDESLRPVVLESAAAMYAEYVRAALHADPHSEKTKGFYSWGSMAFYELYTSAWPGTQPYAARTVAMARWMIDVQHVVDSGGNTGHAFEGLAVAWELARLTNDTRNQQHIGAAIERGLSRLITWQIGSPLTASAAVPETFRSAKARGGIVTAPRDPRIRIDVVQHQLHATLLSRLLLFRPDEAADGR